MGTYFLVYMGAGLLALAATPLVVRLARRLNLMDAPGVRKVHATAVPRIGGMAIFVAMLGITVPMLMLDDFAGGVSRKIYVQILALLAGGAFMFLLGLIDDVWDLRARDKFLAQIVAAAAMCYAGIRIDEISFNGWLTVAFGGLAWPITIFWIVGITNAVNLIDGLDGLAAGITAVTCAVIAVFALYTGQAVMALLMLALLGSLTGFLFYNFNPARVFLGDCGTMFLGFILATASVLCAEKASTLVGLALPSLALGIPIFDTFFAVLRRFAERRSIFSPDRCHIHHRLLDKGLRHRHVVILMYAVTLVAAGMGMFMMFTRDTGSILVFMVTLLLLVLVFRMVGPVGLRGSISAIQRNRAIAREVREDKRHFEDAVLRMREAGSFDAWWQAVCEAADAMKFVSLRLPVDSRSGVARSLIWRSHCPDYVFHNMINLDIPVRHRRSGPPLRIRAAVHVNGSLEAAGRRVAFFSRLIDEHSLAAVPPGSVRQRGPRVGPEPVRRRLRASALSATANDERVELQMTKIVG